MRTNDTGGDLSSFAAKTETATASRRRKSEGDAVVGGGAGTMSRQVFEFGRPTGFVTGTVGMPGERTFSLQARRAGEITSVVLEKTQVVVLAERTDQLLDEASTSEAAEDEIPARPPRSAQRAYRHRSTCPSSRSFA